MMVRSSRKNFKEKVVRVGDPGWVGIAARGGGPELSGKHQRAYAQGEWECCKAIP